MFNSNRFFFLLVSAGSEGLRYSNHFTLKKITLLRVSTDYVGQVPTYP